MHKIYIWIDGEHFEPDRFQADLEDGIKGSVESRKKVKDGIVEESGRYWKSQVIEIKKGHPEDHLEKLLQSLRTTLTQVRGNRIVAEVVYEYKKPDEVKGFYIPDNIIKMLADIGASLDIDVVRSLE